MRYVLNAIIAKRTGAGGFQISCNFACAALLDSNTDWHLIVSKDVGEYIRNEFDSKLFSQKVHVFPSQPDRKTYWTVRKQVQELEKQLKADIIYSILAPSYFSFSSPEVMRCCNAWDLIPFSHVACKTAGYKHTLRMKMKAKLIIHLMRKTPYFITQTEEAKKGICRVTHALPENVCVVPNVLNRTFAQANKTPIEHRGFNIAFVGAPATHKNVRILPEVALVMKNKYKCDDIRFITTLFEKDPLTIEVTQKFASYGIQDMLDNRGRQSQAQLIDLYRSCDMGFFPSLLETFSATLLEYMCFGLPTVISDMSFNTEVMEDAALKYSSLNADEAADQIYRIYTDKSLQHELRLKGYEQLKKYESFDRYYNDTLQFLTEVAYKR